VAVSATARRRRRDGLQAVRGGIGGVQQCCRSASWTTVSSATSSGSGQPAARRSALCTRRWTVVLCRSTLSYSSVGPGRVDQTVQPDPRCGGNGHLPGCIVKTKSYVHSRGYTWCGRGASHPSLTHRPVDALVVPRRADGIPTVACHPAVGPTHPPHHHRHHHHQFQDSAAPRCRSGGTAPNTTIHTATSSRTTIRIAA
jgi:hypothetical protein